MRTFAVAFNMDCPSHWSEEHVRKFLRLFILPGDELVAAASVVPMTEEPSEPHALNPVQMVEVDTVIRDQQNPPGPLDEWGIPIGSNFTRGFRRL